MFEDLSPTQLGLLQTGLSILGNAYGPNANNAIAIGGLQGLQAMRDARRDEEDRRYRQVLTRGAEAKATAAEQQHALNQHLVGLLGGGGGQPTLLASGMPANDAGPALLGGGQSRPGLANMSLDDVALIKALGGPDLTEQWKIGQEGIRQEAGAYYTDPYTRERRYMPRLDNGVALVGGQAQALPGYAAAQQEIEGMRAGAQQRATAERDLVEVPDGRGGTVFKTREQVVQEANQGQGPQATASPLTREAITAAGALDAGIFQMDRLRETAKGLIESPGFKGISGMSLDRLSSLVPGTDAANAVAQFTTLKSQIAQNVLQMYRDMSATGGAVGQVSNFEQELFQNNLAALDRAQSPKAMKESLERVINFVEESTKRMRRAYDAQYGPNAFEAYIKGDLRAPGVDGPASSTSAASAATGGGVAAPRSRAEYDALPSGATFRAPDGTLRRKP